MGILVNVACFTAGYVTGKYEKQIIAFTAKQVSEWKIRFAEAMKKNDTVAAAQVKEEMAEAMKDTDFRKVVEEVAAAQAQAAH